MQVNEPMSEKKADLLNAEAKQLPAHASRYPLSRLAPQFDLVDMAREIQEADRVLNLRASAKLQVIANRSKLCRRRQELYWTKRNAIKCFIVPNVISRVALIRSITFTAALLAACTSHCFPCGIGIISHRMNS